MRLRDYGTTGLRAEGETGNHERSERREMGRQDEPLCEWANLWFDTSNDTSKDSKHYITIPHNLQNLKHYITIPHNLSWSSVAYGVEYLNKRKAYVGHVTLMK
jgi:hypothetical protein